MPDGKVGIRIVKFGFVRHLFLLAQQVPVVQAGVQIVNQNARKNKTRRSGFSLEAPLVLLFYSKLDSFIQNNSCACFT